MKKPKDLIDELLAGCKTPADIAGENGLLKQLTKAIIERAMQAELTTHLGYEKHSVEGHNTGNSRNGTSGKRLKGDFGTLEIAVPRDREASFEPQLVAKGETRWHGFDDKILSLYARGMTTREIPSEAEGSAVHSTQQPQFRLAFKAGPFASLTLDKGSVVLRSEIGCSWSELQIPRLRSG